MLLFWRIRYFDRRTKRFEDRDLFLLTDTLDPATKAAVEACRELGHSGDHRGMLKYRQLFKEEKPPNLQAAGSEYGFDGFSLPDYFEDENRVELTGDQLAECLTGNKGAVRIPAGAKQHDIDYILAEKPTLEVEKVVLQPHELKLLGYFSRDLREMGATAFFREGPGQLRGFANKSAPMVLATAVTDEEIRSHTIIFRRLYMPTEPANFQNACAVFGRAFSAHPIAKWVTGGAAVIAADLKQPPDFVPFVRTGKPTFTLKRLIDVFLYTQYAHQPDERRQRQFEECLRELQGDRAILTYLFLSELWTLCIQMRNVGVQIVHLFNIYCQHHGVAADVIASPRDAHPGIGTLETKQAKRDRIMREKARDLAAALWEQAGRPPVGADHYFAQALAQLKTEVAP